MDRAPEQEIVPASPLMATAIAQLEELARHEVESIIGQARVLEQKAVADGWSYNRAAHCWTRPKPKEGEQ